ncbi:MAG: hypothetical protein LBD79_06855 [Treponema sp.]|jgi:hypothetical protein|nr:hypothetical protein [Treponema sp.]
MMIDITEIIEVLCVFIGLPGVICFFAYKGKKLKQEKKALELKLERERIRLELLEEQNRKYDRIIDRHRR